MSRIARITVFALLFCAWSGTNAQDSGNGSCSGFGYGEEQEREWGECWPACNGDNQSPIDVEPRDATTLDLSPVDGPFNQDRDIPFRFNLTNENYTVTVRLENSSYLYLEGGPLGGRYFLEHLQLCWGSDDSVGSEHTFNGQRYPMESQFGLYNEQYGNYEEASKHPGGVLRIAHMYPIQEEDNPSFAPIVRALPEVVQPGQTTTPNEELTYDELFSGYPANDYFHYNGSFTTPPCSETVKWFVFRPQNGISKEQVAAFRQLQSTDGPLENNYRQLQPLNGRELVVSDEGAACQGECGTSASNSARRLAGKRHLAAKSGRRSAHGSAKRHGAARRRHH